MSNPAAATLILICGLPGSGKTTLAKRLERERNALRLCPDEWIATLLRDPVDREELHRLRSPVEAMQWEVAARALTLGTNVILEWGFWSKAERTDYRMRAEALGAIVETHVLIVEREELRARLSRRNADLPPGTVTVTEAELDVWWDLFGPLADEP
ncbi:MAG: ATP-binding protein [bacterium]